MVTSRSSLLVAASVALALGPSAAAQTLDQQPSRLGGHVTALAGNLGLGALTGGVLQALKGGSFKDGFVRGALGGAVMYAGKRTAARRSWGAGLMGREIHAVGVSMVRNASDGEPSFARLFLPLGPLPVRATLMTGGGVRMQPQLDLMAAWWLAGGVLGSGLGLDLGHSVSSGAPVFQADQRWLDRSDPDVQGLAIARTIFLGDPALAPPFAAPQADVLAHERVHVLQQDFLLTAWGDPFAGVALSRFDAGRWIQRRATLDALGWVVGAVSHLAYGTDRQQRFPTELEARFFTGR